MADAVEREATDDCVVVGEVTGCCDPVGMVTGDVGREVTGDEVEIDAVDAVGGVVESESNTFKLKTYQLDTILV